MKLLSTEIGVNKVQSLIFVPSDIVFEELNIPEEGCDQEVHAVVCFKPEDAQKATHTQFDSRPEEKTSGITL